MNDKDDNKANFVNHIMAGESRFKINYSATTEDNEPSLNISYNWSPKGVKGEFSPHPSNPEK